MNEGTNASLAALKGKRREEKSPAAAAADDDDDDGVSEGMDSQESKASTV